MTQTSVNTTARLLTPLQSSVLRTLFYFDIFRFPLTTEEVWKTLPGHQTKKEEVAECLQELEAQNLLGNKDGFYFFEDAQKVEERKEAGKRAEKFRKIAFQKGQKMSRFPYVRAIMVSGSLSKGQIRDDGDIDYFIVTQANRLWIARTLLILFKKIFLLNSHQFWCVNYFVDTEHLTIEDQNLFTATELKWLLPLVNPEIFHEVMAANPWADSWFPNFGTRDTENCLSLPQKSWGKTLEKFFNGRIGDRIDAWCMRQTLKRWHKKFAHFDEEKMDIALRSRKYVSKHHPSDFQNQVKLRLTKKMTAFETRHDCRFPQSEALWKL